MFPNNHSPHIKSITRRLSTHGQSVDPVTLSCQSHSFRKCSAAFCQSAVSYRGRRPLEADNPLTSSQGDVASCDTGLEYNIIIWATNYVKNYSNELEARGELWPCRRHYFFTND